MKSNRVTVACRLSLSFFALVLFFASCNLGLETAPVARKGAITVSLSGTGNASGAANDTANARALSANAGFLYLQTGLTADTAKLHGPYPVSSGAAVTIADIEAGSYAAISLLFVPELPSLTLSPIIPATATAEGMRVATQTALSGFPDVRDAASVAFIPDYTVLWGRDNPIRASLVPLTALEPNGDGDLDIAGSVAGVTRRFIRVSGLQARFPVAGSGTVRALKMTVSNSSASAVSLTGVGLYDARGGRLVRENPATTLDAGSAFTRSVEWTGEDEYYAYVEFSGLNVTCSFLPTTTALRTVTFDANGGTGTIAPQSGLEGTAITLPSSGFTREGYTFLGWAAIAEASVPEFAPGSEYALGAGDVTLYAIWSAAAAIRTVTYVGNGGTGSVAAQSGPEGAQITLAANGFSNPGYSFLGWSVNPAATTPEYSALSVFTFGPGDTVLYAIWAPSATVRSIVYDGNGGSGSVASQSGSEGAQITLSPNGFTRTGYTFQGWSVDQMATTPEYPAGYSYTLGSGNVTLYAIWADVTAPSVSSPTFLSPYTNTALAPNATMMVSELGRGIRSITVSGASSFTSPTVKIGASTLTPNVSGTTLTLTDPVTTSGIVTVTGINLPAGDGSKTITFTITDDGGNASPGASAVVTLDTTAPSASSYWVYDLDTSSPSYTNSPSVRLMLTYGEDSTGATGVSRVELTGFDSIASSSITFAGTPQPIASRSSNTINLATPKVGNGTIIVDGTTLPSGEGLITVSVRLIDAAGNVSSSLDASTLLDLTAPALTITTGTGTYTAAGTVTNGTTLYSTATGTINYNSNDFGGSDINGYSAAGWFVAASPATYQASGASWITVTDNAGNATTLNFTTVLDMTGPIASNVVTLNANDCTVTIDDLGCGYDSGAVSCSYSNTYYTAGYDPSSGLTWMTGLTMSWAGSVCTISGLPTGEPGTGYDRFIKLEMQDRLGNTTTRYIYRRDMTTFSLY